MIGHKGRFEAPQFFRLISIGHGKAPLPQYLLLAQFLLVTVASATGLTGKNTCEKEWTQLQTDSRFASNTSKVKQFESYAPSCAGSGLYEVQLSQLYLEANDVAKAKQVLQNALKQNMPHRRELLFKEGVAYLVNQELAKAQDTFQTVIKDYPDSYDGYSGLGGVLLMRHHPKESIEQYEKANLLHPTSPAYRNLVIAYALERRFQDATIAFDKYYRLDNGAFGDRDVAMSAAIAYSEQGKLAQADGTLRGLLQAKPQVKDDKEFVELFRKVNAELLAKKK